MEHHTLRHLIVFLFIGGVIGWLAGVIISGRGFGILGDVAVGIVGAILGGCMARILGLTIVTSGGEFLMALIGAIVLVGLTRFIVRNAAAAGHA